MANVRDFCLHLLVESSVTLTPRSLLSIKPVNSLLKVMTAYHRKPDQGEGHSHVKTIASHIITCFERARAVTVR